MSARPSIAFAFPGSLATPTGGYVYDRRVIAALRARGIAVTECLLPASFPWPQAADIAESVERLRAVRADALIVDGLAYGALPADALAQVSTPLVALVHHPLFLETGLSPAQSETLRAAEREALRRAAAVIVTGPLTARIVRETFGVAPVAVAEPGVDPAPRATGGDDGIVRMLAVGALSPRKGYDILLRALAGVDGAWRLTIVGARDRAPDCARDLDALVESAGLRDRIAFAGVVSDEALAMHYARADAFVHPAFLEGYGMAIADAVARGLPILASREAAQAGAADGAGLLTAPAGDVAAFRAALARLVGEAELRARLSARSWAAAARQTRWEDCADRILRAVEGVRGA